MSAAAKQVEVKERPILFSGPMVRAILEGRKTQTRRVLKSKWFELSEESGHLRYTEYDPPRWHHGDADEDGRYLAGSGPFDPKKQSDQRHAASFCPYGGNGDRLWVREAFAHLADLKTKDPGTAALMSRAFFRADHPTGLSHDDASDLKWRSPLFLPRSLSRLTLEVTNVRVERLQEITQADAIAEGMRRHHASGVYSTGADLSCYATAREAFAHGWDSSNQKRGFPFDSNIWVWVIEFRKL